MKPINFLILSIICLFFACQQNNVPAPNASCDWLEELMPIVQDTCFQPSVGPFGTIIPPYENYNIDQIVLSKIDQNVIYFISKQTPDIGPVDLYKVNLCANEVQFVATLEHYLNNSLRLNSKDQIIYIEAILSVTNQNIVAFDINEQSNIPLLSNKSNINRVGWASDTSFIVEEGIFVNGNPTFARLLYHIEGNTLDTILLTPGTFSNPLGDKIALNSSYGHDNKHLFIYSASEREITEAYSLENENWSATTIILDWLNEEQIQIREGSGITGSFDLANNQIDVFFNPDEIDCRNVFFNRLGVALDNEHLLQIRGEYFFNEEGEYRLRNDIIRYNMETGLEELIVLE